MKENKLTKPPCTLIRLNEPDLELMARAIRNSYYKSIRKEIKQKVEQESILQKS